MSGALQGRRVLVPRGGRWGERVAAQLTAHGAVPVIAPLIATAAPVDTAARDDAFAALAAGAFDWVLITSAAGVEAVGATPLPGGPRLAVVGPETARAATAEGRSVAFRPDGPSSAAALAEQWA
ncbi:uroporphyrinogen-III synthase, partial [Microbacterium gorillae]|uniref:uroporphyrinogen-III synthase n=1 Tax=Microbacterium gorillae TaxID=1231063 RepID=UPI00058B4097